MLSGDVPIYADTVDLESEYLVLVPHHVTVFVFVFFGACPCAVYTASPSLGYSAPVILPWPRSLSWARRWFERGQR